MGVDDRFGHLAEDLFHFSPGFEVKFLPREPHTVLVLNFGARLDAEHGVVRARIRGVDVVNVVRGDDLETELFAEFEQPGDDFLLFGDAVILDFDEIVFFAEDLDKFAAGLARIDLAVVEEVLGNEGSQTPCKSDQSLRIFGQSLHIRARFVVKSAQMGVGDEFEEILVAGKIFGEEAEMVIAFAILGAAFLLQARPGGHVELTADQRFDAIGLGGVEELNGAE